MEKTLAVINQLEQAGLIGRYAIGGAVAATRHGLTPKWADFRKRFLNENE